MASQINGPSGLEWLERLMQISALRVFPPSRFHCRLLNQPDHLVPAPRGPAKAADDASGDALRLNPDTSFTHDDELPAALAGDASLLDNFALQGPIAWVETPGSHALQAFWLHPEWSAILTDVSPGEPLPTALTPRARRTLALANVVGEPDSFSRGRAAWVEATTRLARQFKERGYAPVGQLIHPFQIGALRRYYRYLIRTGGLALGDAQSSRRYVAHNDSVARFFHHQLVHTVSVIAGEAVKPSYVYVASYQSGAKLEKHTDREQCEFSITLCLDYSPEPRSQTRWPIHLHSSTSRVTVFQAIGDGLLYRGHELPHSRDPLPLQDTSTSIFFHYVREAFSGNLD